MSRIFNIIIMLCICSFVSGAQSLCEIGKYGLVSGVDISVRPSYVMPTHGLYSGYNDFEKPVRSALSLHARYSMRISDEEALPELFSKAYQGVGLSLHTFFAHELTGTPVGLYLYQGLPFLNLTDRLSLGYEWNFGLTAGWKKNAAVGSSFNAYVNVGVLFSYALGCGHILRFGPEYTHFSNGDTCFPNGGANTVGLSFTLSREFMNNVSTDRKVPVEYHDYRGMTYDIIAYGALRADRTVSDRLYIINRKFPLAGLQFNPLYHTGPYLSFGPSLDLMYDGSANLYGHVRNEDESVTYQIPDLSAQLAAGISGRAELRMPFFAVNLGAGINLLKSGEDMRRFYAIFALKGFVTDRFFLHVGYRMSELRYTHNLMFGLGVRI